MKSMKYMKKNFMYFMVKSSFLKEKSFYLSDITVKRWNSYTLKLITIISDNCSSTQK
jgi:uncharacterized protein (DUF1919 family)